MDNILEWFGPGIYEERMARMRSFWNGEERFVVSVNASHNMYRQVVDEEVVLARAPSNLRTQARLPGLNLPAFFADFGTVTTARHWGARPGSTPLW